jgi:signal transduction histidine kinase/CheY-like chemotaxis protein
VSVPARGDDAAAELRARLDAAERDLARAREEIGRLSLRARAAELASERKTRFIGNVSHEFRTPLSSIIGFADLLARSGEGELPASVRAEYLEIVHRNARHLLHVVNDLLNISKVEAGTLEVSAVALRAADVAAVVIAALMPQASERGLRVHLVDEATRAALADAGRLRQVLFNLLENAIKYSPEGEEIVVRTADAAGCVRVEVVDRGPGIHPSAQPRLFKEFSRVNPPGSRVVGAGLGLALSRMLTEAMGGRVEVDTEPGRGSTFWVELPAAAGAPVPLQAPYVAEAPVPVPRGRGECVAIVDDDADIRAYAAAALARFGYRPVPDHGGAGVGERLAAVRPAAVLLDLDLGDRTGSEALEEMRLDPVLAGVPVVAFTAASTVAAEPFAGRLLKPATPEEMAACVAGVLLREAQPPRDGAGIAGEGAGGRDEDPAEDEESFMAPLRARFRAGLPDRLREIEACAAAGDDEALIRAVHKLRGAAGGYGLDVLERRAAAAEEALRRDPDAAAGTVRRLVDALRGEVESGT